MARGRKRNTNDPTVPKHIDQAKVPAGIYWDKSGAGRWYTRERQPNGKTKATTIAQRSALLSDLHAIAEARAGRSASGTIGHVMDGYHDSTEYAALAPRTQADYARQREIVRAMPTKTGATLDTLQVDAITPAVIQRLVEMIAKGRPPSRPGAKDGEPGKPTKANHLHRYLRLVFSWGVRFGYCKTNPAKGVRQAKEKGDAKMPDLVAFRRVVDYARQCGAMKAHTAGSCPPYLWAVVTIAYYCRLRLIEVVSLTDADELPEGIFCRRKKGSLDTVTKWSPELRQAWDALVAHRKAGNDRHGRPVPLRPELRLLVASQDGTPLQKSSLDTAWQRLITRAIEQRIIAAEDRFALHGVKHRGITDSADKDSGGHKTESMKRLYDHSVAVFEPAGDAEFSGSNSGAAPKGRLSR